MRNIEVGDQNPNVHTLAMDDSGRYGASHNYVIAVIQPDAPSIDTAIHFQEGPVKEVGVNGITGESLIAIVIDRLKGFQTGKFPCRENAIALTHLETALMWMNKRTAERIQKGVEGKDKNHE
jgi:hypothetical protein